MRVIQLFFILFFAISSTMAQVDWEKELRSELVTLNDGKFVAAENTLLTFDKGSFQVEFYAEATNDGRISRDKFVAMYSVFVYEFVETVMEEMGSPDTYQQQSLESIEGEADISVKIIWNDSGMIVDLRTSNGTETFNKSWKEIFEGS